MRNNAPGRKKAIKNYKSVTEVLASMTVMAKMMKQLIDRDNKNFAKRMEREMEAEVVDLQRIKEMVKEHRQHQKEREMFIDFSNKWDELNDTLRDILDNE